MTPSLLDTHYWIWIATSNTEEIDTAARNELLKLEKAGMLYVSDVSVWEMARLAADGLIDFKMSIDRVVSETVARGNVQLLPISTRILIESTRLPGTIHRDPADRLLVATARENGLVLISRDRQLRSYGEQGHLKVRKI